MLGYPCYRTPSCFVWVRIGVLKGRDKIKSTQKRMGGHLFFLFSFHHPDLLLRQTVQLIHLLIYLFGERGYLNPNQCELLLLQGKTLGYH